MVEWKNLGFGQKTLYIILLSLILLMVIFSFESCRRKNYEGFLACVEEIARGRGEEQANSFRSVNNCCVGAGGQLTYDGKKYGCAFEK